MIPKIIHYCWFSGEPIPDPLQANINNWKKIMPDFELRCCDNINEVRNKPLYLQDAFRARKWAFVTDYMRCYLLYTYGGIYLDTDVEVFKSFNHFINNNAFVGTEVIPTPWKTIEIHPEVAIMGGVKNHSIFRSMLDVYEKRRFELTPYHYDMTEMPKIVVPVFRKYGYQHKDEDQVLNDNIQIYSSSVFSNRFLLKEGIYALHQMKASWRPGGRMYRLLVERLHLYRLYHFYFNIRKRIRRFFS